jgi:large subunit ribosomal protein L30
MAKIKVTQIRSKINYPETQKRTLAALGLKKMHATKVHEDTPQIMGMITKVQHLVRVEK